ncbi:MAG: type I DNA topoisomerase [bacterium]|nr:type I DNA topoisomerase [bacterium]
MKLLIVESPAKAKTISKYLDGEFTVKASVGHIRDLPKSNKKALDIENGFIPHYEISKGKENIVAEIKALSEKATEVLLATDPDREGEAIAWHIAEAVGLKKPKRITFHEITKDAVKEAVLHPRHIDMNLKEAQEARRVLDRLVGYELSGLIWKKVRYGLSAGRVQSPALRIVVEREREIRAFKADKYWTIEADFKNDTISKMGLPSITFTCSKEPTDIKTVEEILEVAKENKWAIKDINETEVKRSPKAPFTTSTLQQTASSRLGLSPSNTMRIAQKLYEAGLISYMRTDSTTLSKVAQAQIAVLVEKDYGKEFVEVRDYVTKSKNAQEAHEAIRPTVFFKKKAGTPEQNKLYQLIWQRTVASQMTDANTLRTKISANISNITNFENLENSEKSQEKNSKESSKEIPDFNVNGSRILFPGWLKADPDAQGDEVSLPKFTVGESLELLNIHSDEKETLPPPRYTEAGLVKELEKRGIGRPSTYASIIKTIEERGYVEKEARSIKPTDTGEVVSTFLEENFNDYISDTFTAEMEDKLDSIAKGEYTYLKTLTDFYKPFHKEVKAKEKTAKITNLGDADPKWLCPKCKSKMIIKLGKNGKFMSCSLYPDCEGARTIDGVELAGPKMTGEKCPECTEGMLVEREGRFGTFISCSRYPKCKFIKKDPELDKKNSTGVKCPTCKDGMMMARRGRFGMFYSCSNYPDCKTAIKAKPTGRMCDYKREDKIDPATGKTGVICGALMMEGTKTIPERCSDKICPNHNPHKLVK